MGVEGGRCSCGWWVGILKSNLLVLLTLTGVAVGFGLGFGVRSAQPSQDAVIWIGLPGEMYMRMLKMMILPLIICSVITGTASLDPKCNGKVSMVALGYIIFTNSIPSFVSIALGFIIKPGVGIDLTDNTEHIPNQVIDTPDIFADLIRNLFPDNVITACFKQAQTKYSITEKIITVNSSGDAINETMVTRTKQIGSADSTNVLGLVICCMIFGIATTAVGEVGKPFIAFFHSASEIIMKILKWLVWFTPIGVASLIAVALLKAGKIGGTFKSLGMFALTVIVGLAIYQLLVVPVLYFITTRQNPYKLLMTLGRPWMVAFAAASSAIAIPETLNSLEVTNKADRRISRFVVPFAATINRDGSSLYITAACIFIGQLADVKMDGGKIVLIWILTTIISLAVPSVPSAGVVAVLINLTALSIPVGNIGLLFAMEWLLDRFRSASNMLSHGYCTMVTLHLCKSSLPTPEEENQIEILVKKPIVKNATNLSCNSLENISKYDMTV